MDPAEAAMYYATVYFFNQYVCERVLTLRCRGKYQITTKSIP
jgi:hypothetical protein